MGDNRQASNDESAFDYRELYQKYKLATWALGVATFYFAVAYFFPLPDEVTKIPIRPWPVFEHKGGALEFRRAFGSALVSFAAFGAIMQMLSFKSRDRELAEAFPRVIASSVSFLRSFNNPQQRQFVGNTLNALLGDNIGRSTFDYIMPMLQENAGFRQEFEYDVIIDDNPPARANDEVKRVFQVENYRWVSETLTYKLLHPTKPDNEHYPRGPFNVLFLFEKTSLELLSRDQSVFARFLVELEPAALEWLFNGTDEEAVRKFNSAIAPNLWEKFDDSNDELQLETRVSLEEAIPSTRNRTKRYFKVEMVASLKANPGRSKLMLTFGHPYRREATHFIFTHPQPVLSPKITFDYNRATSMIDVDYSRYYSIAKPQSFRTKPPEKSTDRYEFIVEDSWVFPTSGITMVWKNEEVNRGAEMSSSTGTRHIVPCRHRGAEKRIYVVWRGDGDGGRELELAMKQFGETDYNANAEPTEHFTKIEEHLRRSGFEPFLA